MAKLTEYPIAKKFDKNDIFIKDGTNGTQQIAVEDAAAEFGAMLADDTLSEAGKLAPADTVGEELARLETAIETRIDISHRLSGTIVDFDDGLKDTPLTALTVGIEAGQAGTGDPSPENIRAISGWTRAKIRRTARNLWGGDALLDDVKDALPSATKNAEARTIYFASGTAVSHALLGSRSVDKLRYGVRFKENTQYTFIFTGYKPSKPGANMAVAYTDGTSYTFTFTSVGEKSTIVYTTPAGKTVLCLYKLNSSEGTTLYADECGLFEGVVSAEEFVPYDGAEVSVDWEAAAGEVCGGTLNVLTGELTVTHRLYTLTGEETWTLVGTTTTGYFRAKITSSRTTYEDSSADDFLSSHFPLLIAAQETPGIRGQDSQAANGYTIQIRPFTYGITTAAALKEWVKAQYDAGTPVQIVIRRVVPTVYQLTPAQLSTLLGENRVWADSGDVDLMYTADTKIYIDDGDAASKAYADEIVSGALQNIAAAPASYTAERSYSVGEFLILDSTLYKVTSAIAVGETFQPGVNIAKTTIGEELTAIWAAVNS